MRIWYREYGMSKTSGSGPPDTIIATMIDDLREEHERGEISCLAVVVVRHTATHQARFTEKQLL